MKLIPCRNMKKVLFPHIRTFQTQHSVYLPFLSDGVHDRGSLESVQICIKCLVKNRQFMFIGKEMRKQIAGKIYRSLTYLLSIFSD